MVPRRARTQTNPPGARNQAGIIDDFITTLAISLRSTTPKSEMSVCAICLDTYLENDVVVVLPCHTTHHFHRACIQVRDFLPSSLALMT
ncbi:hypothetical protein VP01_148g11 [Puccinia sorghi]|uniref:RING-type domain-containing protein n=1 Tax=Puccinia sorghi TaxID=27349 RepID=A0A0L6VJJ4_9BASI|nr:hypothetical protein VP01_148g11 [Puccinia sorghi]